MIIPQLPPPPAGTGVRMILCRHGETALNAQYILQGRGVDPPLNERGCVQAQRLADRLASVPIDWIVSSELERARQTADIIAAYHTHAPRNEYVDLAEISWGEFEGTQSPNLKVLHDAWESGDFDYATKGGESPNFVVQRAIRQLIIILDKSKEMPSRSGTPTVAVVVHGRLLRIILSTLLHRSLYFMSSMAHANSNINVVDVVLGTTPTLTHHSLVRLADLSCDELTMFAHCHLAVQTTPSAQLGDNQSTINSPATLIAGPKSLTSICQLKSSYARVYNSDLGVLCAPWPISIIEQFRSGLAVNAVATMNGELNEKVDQPNTWWFIGTVINDSQHLAGLSFAVI